MKTFLLIYLIIVYPSMGLIVWIRFKQIKETIQKFTGEMGMIIAKGIFESTGLKKKVYSPQFIIGLSIIAIIAAPFVFPIFLIEEIKDLFKKKERKKNETDASITIPVYPEKEKEIKFLSDETNTYEI
jgi:hypothetical protein